MNTCYILYSFAFDTFYIGCTQEDVSIRLAKHNAKTYGSKYTSFTNDWILYHCIDCESFQQAVNIERHIKRMKSKTYLQNLKRYPEISEKLLIKYRSV